VHTWIYSKLSLWISLTEGMRDDVLECTRVPREKAAVVRHGTDLEKFDPSRYHIAEARTRFGLPQDKRIVAVLGRLDPGKGQEVLLRAIPEIVKEHDDVLFLIAGDETAGEPGYKKHLETIGSELGIGRWVRFMNFTDDVPGLMAAIDVLALPSFSETFGLVLIEAMAMEKTIVATNAGGVPEIITHEKNGLLVEPRDARSLARAISRVLGDRQLAGSLAKQGREEAVLRYDFGRCVDSLLSAMSDL
jgi:D-inositol-3-phosphate glycosyltransferase